MNFKKALVKFGRVVQRIGPVIIHLIAPQLDPIASVIIHAIDEAEKIKGAKTGAAKLEHVQAVVASSAAAFNLASPNKQIDVAALRETVAGAVGTVVSAANVLVKP